MRKTHKLALLMLSALWCSSAAATLSPAVPIKSNTAENEPFRGANTTSLTVILGGAPTMWLCPGATHAVQVSQPEARAMPLFVVTATIGADNAALDPDSDINPSHSPTSHTLVLPCDAQGDVVLAAVAAIPPTPLSPAPTAALTLPIDPSCTHPRCTDAIIGAASTASSVAGKNPSQVPPATRKTTPLVPEAAHNTHMGRRLMQTEPSQESNEGTGNATRPQMCASSSLGYSCALRLRAATLHYTVSPSPIPPNNACTGILGSTGSGWTVVDGALVYAHFALEGDLPGFAALGFTQRPGHMVPSNVVLGSVGENGSGQVHAYRLTGYFLPAPLPEPNWAVSKGVARTPQGHTLVCFTRGTQGVDAAAAPTTPSTPSTPGRRSLAQAALPGHPLLDLTRGADLIWAVHSDTSGAHLAQGSLRLDLLGGQVDSLAAPSRRKLVIAHGALMATTFVLLMPSGVLMARHKRVFLGRQVFGKGAWFVAHQATQALAVACFIAGVTIALAKFSRTARAAPQRILDAHWVLGIALCALVGLQVLVAVLARPAPGSPRRPLWFLVHRGMGLLTVAAGLANVGLGIFLWEDNGMGRGRDWVAWAVPCAAVALAVFMAELMLSCAPVAKHVGPAMQAPFPSASAVYPLPLANASVPFAFKNGVANSAIKAEDIITRNAHTMAPVGSANP